MNGRWPGRSSTTTGFTTSWGARRCSTKRAMAARYQKEYGVITYVGQKLSFQAHMNPLAQRVPMIDYINHAR